MSPLLKPETRMACEMGDVFRIARRKIVDAKNGVALAQQAIGEVGTKKPGSAGDKNTHASNCHCSKTYSGHDNGPEFECRALPERVQLIARHIRPQHYRLSTSAPSAACLPAPGTLAGLPTLT